MDSSEAQKVLQRTSDARKRLLSELSKVMIGQEEIMEHLLICVLARGHCLLTGVPGLGKTMLVKTLAQTLSLSFRRIQFTPDLMPADISGTDIVEEDAATGERRFRFIHGPIFANLVLADEINRTPPKTQAALLEAMEERQVTAGGRTYPLDPPFFVLATQNPIELEGTYPLPEAQLDRFLLNLVMDYLPLEDEVRMVTQTTSDEVTTLQEVFSRDEILELQALVRQVPVAEAVARYAVRLSAATRNMKGLTPSSLEGRIRWGAGSRASQALVLAGKARALLQGRVNVSIEDIKALAKPVLRHRIIPGFEAEADGFHSDKIIEVLLNEISEDKI